MGKVKGLVVGEMGHNIRRGMRKEQGGSVRKKRGDVHREKEKQLPVEVEARESRKRDWDWEEEKHTENGKENTGRAANALQPRLHYSALPLHTYINGGSEKLAVHNADFFMFHSYLTQLLTRRLYSKLIVTVEVVLMFKQWDYCITPWDTINSLSCPSNILMFKGQ